VPSDAHAARSAQGFRRQIAHKVCATLLLTSLVGGSAAQPPDPAAVGRDRPLTSTWLCENERSVLLNAHPRRPNEEAWLTYAGTRVAVERLRTASGVAFESRDLRVRWYESGDDARLEFPGLLREPVICRRQERSPR